MVGFAIRGEGTYGVKQYKQCEEGTNVKVIDYYRSRISSIISGKNDTEVFNCGLCRAMPEHRREMQ